MNEHTDTPNAGAAEPQVPQPEIAARPRRRRRHFPVDPYFMLGMGAVLLAGATLYKEKPTLRGPAELPAAVSRYVEGAGLGHRLGAADAEVRVVELADYECPACREAHAKTWPAIQALVRGGRVSYTVYDLPLPSHRYAIPAAVTAECAAQQDEALYWRLRDRLYGEQAWLQTYPVEEPLARMAAELGADAEAVRACVREKGSEWAGLLQAGWNVATKSGLNYVPAWSVNGRMVVWTELEREIRRELGQPAPRAALAPAPAAASTEAR